MPIRSIFIRTLVIVFLLSQGPSMANWLRIKRKCINVFQNIKTFEDSEIACQNLNAQLFIIENQEELDFFANLIRNANIYVGLKKEQDGKWKWINGGEFSRTEWWLTNQPGTNSYAYFRNGKLYGSSSAVGRWYVCERKCTYTPSPCNMTTGSCGFCGVEIMPNCDGLPCADVCFFYPNCTTYATMANLCVNMKNITDNCDINVKLNDKLYSLLLGC